LLEICALFDTLIADADGIYDPASYNDRLLLGLNRVVTVADQHLPFLPPARHTVSDDFATVLEPNAGDGTPKDIGSSIDRIGQQSMDCIVARRAPLQGPPLRTIDSNRQVNSLLPQP
jgi:hypothetical protein